MADKPVVYVCPHTMWGDRDVAGCLLVESGEVLWDHISSGKEWLIRDLTNGFADRREALEQRFPDGYDVIYADADGIIPADVLARNQAWAEAEKKKVDDRT